MTASIYTKISLACTPSLTLPEQQNQVVTPCKSPRQEHH